MSASAFDRLPFQEVFPANKRSCEHFSQYFTNAGLKELADFAKNQESIGARKKLQKELQEQMSRGDPLKDVSPLFFLTVPLELFFFAWAVVKKEKAIN